MVLTAAFLLGSKGRVLPIENEQQVLNYMYMLNAAICVEDIPIWRGDVNISCPDDVSKLRRLSSRVGTLDIYTAYQLDNELNSLVSITPKRTFITDISEYYNIHDNGTATLKEELK